MLAMSEVMMKRAYEASVEDFFEREAIAQAIALDEFGEGEGRHDCDCRTHGGPHAGRNGSLMIGGPRQVRRVGCEPLPALLPHHVRVSHGAHTIRHPP